eukprot:TRINITY_DN81602_c0_g1_i1.p1 TRINITY_DN81602_c0_g1~~TRINITY_DN81602_c0_g1_i1.p1  ORF type:complete len:438 (-),score=132.00 TRINITY_DN81602_c0_g1_i1:201-1514(-)
MIGDEEIGSFVLDIGSHRVRAGFGGDELPKCVFPSGLGCLETESIDDSRSDGMMEVEKKSKKLIVGGADVNVRRDHMEWVPLVNEDGVVERADYFSAILRHSFENRLSSRLDEMPLLITEPVGHSLESRQFLSQILFEEFRCPAVFLAKTPVLSAFSCGRSSALVVESGERWTTATHVHEGMALQRSVVRSPLAGGMITTMANEYLQETARVKVRPPYSFTRRKAANGEWELAEREYKGTTKSYHDFQTRKVVEDFKIAMFQVSKTVFDARDMENIAKKTYELPDGQKVDVGEKRLLLPEVLFTPSLVSMVGGDGSSAVRVESLPVLPKDQPLPVHIVAAKALQECDRDLLKELGHIVLAGGNTGWSDFSKRFELEASAFPLWTSKMRVNTPTSVDPSYAPWIGGSILASLGTFQSMWVSKQEYEEHGATIIQKKCP